MKDNLNYEEIGKRIQKIRTDKGITQDELAKAIDSSQKYISSIENGKHKIYLSTAVAIANLLKVPLESLINDYDYGKDDNAL